MEKKVNRNVKQTKKKEDIYSVCGKADNKRQNLGIKVSQVELDSLLLFNTRISVAGQAASCTEISRSATLEQVKLYITAAIDVQAEAREQQRGWWREIIVKYKLPKDKEIFVDFSTGDLYIITE